MKKIILLLALTLTVSATYAQKKNSKAVVRADTLKKDSAKVVDPILHINLSKEDATILIKGLLAGDHAASLSEVISAADGSRAINAATFFIQMICQKWPELAPKQ
ncbi:MAG: hypothetical protein V4619_07495 [Bacteroidota bacterium]